MWGVRTLLSHSFPAPLLLLPPRTTLGVPLHHHHHHQLSVTPHTTHSRARHAKQPVPPGALQHTPSLVAPQQLQA